MTDYYYLSLIFNLYPLQVFIIQWLGVLYVFQKLINYLLAKLLLIPLRAICSKTF